MRVVVFGSTGALGRCVLRKLVQEGHKVRAVARQPAVLDDLINELGNDNVTTFSADVFGDNAQSKVTEAIVDQDVVISALGPRTIWTRTATVETGIRLIIEGMKENKVERLIQVSSWGVKPEPHDSFFFKWFICWLLKYALEDHRAAEQLIINSGEGINWTIIRPPGLTNGEETGKYNLHKDQGSVNTSNARISRADVAVAVVKSIDDSETFYKGIAICSA